MGRKYLCDYCDKAFPDNVMNRRNHFRGIQHRQMRQLHYDTLKHAATILAEESTKPPCKKFLKTGECQFGFNCRYSHLTAEKRQELEQQALEEARAKQAARKAKAEQYNPSLEEWLKKKAKKRKTDKTAEPSTGTEENNEDDHEEYELPRSLEGIPNLPPSLLPPTQEDMATAKLEEWG